MRLDNAIASNQRVSQAAKNMHDSMLHHCVCQLQEVGPTMGGLEYLLEELLEELPDELLLELLLLLLLAEPSWSSPRSCMSSTTAARSGLSMRKVLSHFVDILGRPLLVCAQILSKVAVLA